MRIAVSIFVIFALVLFSSSLSLDAGALAVASDYLEDNTLKLVEGNSTIYGIRLQNPDDYDLAVKVDYDKGLMQAIDFKEEYLVHPGETASVKFNITAPKYKKGENIFPLTYTVHQLGIGGSGVGFSPKISKGFKLEVAKSPDRFYIDPLYIVLAAMALAFLLFVSRKKIMDLAKNRSRIFFKKRLIHLKAEK